MFIPKSGRSLNAAGITIPRDVAADTSPSAQPPAVGAFAAGVYDELRRIARLQLRRERPGHTLQPTALVHEAYLRMAGQAGNWQNEQHFFALASQMMRRILVDHGRRAHAEKRGGAVEIIRIGTGNDFAATSPDGIDVIALDDALNALAALDERQARVVELRFFGGLSVEETAQALGVSAVTVKREWRSARAFLLCHLRGEGQ